MIQKPTTADPVIDEIHRVRREISDRFGGDLLAIVEDARKRQAASGHPIWSPDATNHDRDRGRIAADPSHTTWHAGPHQAIRLFAVSFCQIVNRLASPCPVRPGTLCLVRQAQ